MKPYDSGSASSESVNPRPASLAVPSRIALVFGSFRGGGVARAMLRMARGFLARGFAVDLVVGRAQGDLYNEIPEQAGIIELERASKWRARAQVLAADPGAFGQLLTIWNLSGKLRYLPSLVRYFRQVRPNAVFAATAPFNLIAVWARRLARLDARVVGSEHNQLTAETVGQRRWRYDCAPSLLRHGYLQADAIVAVSDGVADELVLHAGIPRSHLTTVYNPIVGPEIRVKARAEVSHPWFEPGEPPVILGVGMLKPQKDFPTLIRAFARMRRERPVRLMILGGVRKSAKDEAYRVDLESLVAELGVTADVCFAGFVPNPFAYMSKAALFVLSSAWEGLPSVLIEALACGCPVVSTDCPSGPAEILANGELGPLVPVGDDTMMAAAIKTILDAPPNPKLLQQRAEVFSIDRAIDRYETLLFGVGS
ncbi:MAG: glycosyltransferase [Candidatus Competibacteraceae bacterium]